MILSLNTRDAHLFFAESGADLGGTLVERGGIHVDEVLVVHPPVHDIRFIFTTFYSLLHLCSQHSFHFQITLFIFSIFYLFSRYFDLNHLCDKMIWLIRPCLYS